MKLDPKQIGSGFGIKDPKDQLRLRLQSQRFPSPLASQIFSQDYSWFNDDRLRLPDDFLHLAVESHEASRKTKHQVLRLLFDLHLQRFLES